MLTAVLSLLAASATLATAAPVDTRSPNELVIAASASDWVAIAPRDLLVMDLAPDEHGKPRHVVIQLMPPPFSQGWIGNIRTLAAAHWWDGTSVNRVQDNYVVQWGDGEAEDKTKAKPLPANLAKIPQAYYVLAIGRDLGKLWLSDLDLQMERRIKAALHGDMSYKEPYADGAYILQGWPVAFGGHQRAWPIHCYGTVGVGRDMPPDTGSGAELYAVIGQAPRQLDRNLAVVGRVIEGIEFLSSLPRGTGDLGFYKTAAERVPIVSVRIGDKVPELPRYEYLSTESTSFARYADARANRRDPFFVVPAGGADICNVPVPVRRVAG